MTEKAMVLADAHDMLRRVASHVMYVNEDAVQIISKAMHELFSEYLEERRLNG